MNLQDEEKMEWPSFPRQSFCPICGESHTRPGHHAEEHHVVPRSRGGKDGPTIYLCWDCHERIRLKELDVRYEKRWTYKWWNQEYYHPFFKEQ